MRSVTCVLLLVVGLTESRHLPGSSDCLVDEPSDDIIVDTIYGKIMGSFSKTTTGNKGFYSFQSIPYAKPPLGELRFQNPEYPSNWTGILDGTKTSKTCLQPFVDHDLMSEDCLFVDVFTPCLSPSESLPVIVWIHGGYFLVGDGALIQGEPDLFIDKDVILVSVNYRLGVFGYLSTGDGVIGGNFAIMDQIMALEWVRDNIANFGGDPQRVTLMGQSAGAASVALLMQTKLSEGLYSAVIMDSGNSLNLWSRCFDPAAVSKLVANYFDIQYNTSEELRQSLQKIDSIDLLLGADHVDLINTALSNPLDGFLFAPSIEPLLEGAVNGLSHHNLKEGKFNKVPVLTGYNSAEGLMFLPVLDSYGIIFEIFDLEPSRLAPSDLNINTSQLHEIGKMVKSTYFQNKAIMVNKDNFVKYITDHEFARPAIEFVSLVSEYVPTYFYRFDYVGKLSLNGTEREVKGATHGDELIYLFYHSNEITPSQKDSDTRERLVRMWTNFAKYHNPTPSADPVLQNITWETATPTKLNYLNIEENLKVMDKPNGKYHEFWKTVYNNYGVPPFDTY